MSGHSKWSKVKHQKAHTDVVKGLAFTKASRAITVAVREGGGVVDPEKNFRLRLALEKARQVNMPKETIERAIERATGSADGMIESVLYEAYGPGGVGILIDAATDNRQRTVSFIKQIIERAGGALAKPGAVSFLFTRIGKLCIDHGGKSEDDMLDIALEIGASDCRYQKEICEFILPVQTVTPATHALHAKFLPIMSAEIVQEATSIVRVPDQTFNQIQNICRDLLALDDVQHVYMNGGLEHT